MAGNTVLLTMDKFKSWMRDPSKFYGHLRKVKIIEIGFDQKTKEYNGTFSVEELSTGIKRNYEHFPIHMITQFFGNGYGAYGMPSVGDIGYIGFLGEGLAIYIGCTPFNLASQTSQNKNFNYMRPVESGEYYIKSKKGVEVYLDNEGSIRIIVNKASDTNRPDNYDTKNYELKIDKDGKLTFDGTVAEISGTSALALKQDIDDIKTFLTSFQTAYNNHMNGAYALVTPFTTAAPTATGTTKLKGA